MYTLTLTVYIFRYRLNFGVVEFYISTESAVWHMEQDKRHPKNLLFIDSNKLKSYDQESITTIVNQSYTDATTNRSTTFQQLRFFVQYQKSIIFIDSQNHCIHKYSRESKTGVKLAGCDGTGFTDGSSLSAKFNSPISAIRSNTKPNQLYIVDQGNKAIRAMNGISVTTLVRLNNRSCIPTTLIQEHNLNSLIVAGNECVLRVSLKDKRVTGLLQSDINFPYSITDLTAIVEHVYVMADTNSNQLVLMDLRMTRISELCSSNASECFTAQPTSLLLKRNKIFIGSFKAILQISGKTMSEIKIVD